MSTVWVHAAAGCAAIASWLYKAPSCHDSRLPGEEPAVAHDCGSSWTILILRMLQVSLRQGSSIPRALDMVGKAVGGDCGARMSEVGSSLARGVPWADAWHAAMAVQHEGAPADSSSGNVPAERNEILACCNRLWNRHGRMAICLACASNPPLNSWTVTSVPPSNGMPRSCR